MGGVTARGCKGRYNADRRQPAAITGVDQVKTKAKNAPAKPEMKLVPAQVVQSVQKKTPIVKCDAARTATAQTKLEWLVAGNVKRPGSASHARAASYWGVKDVSEYVAKGGTRADLNWDADHGFVVVKPD